MFSLIETIDLLKQIATKHKQINSMGFGDAPQLGAAELMLYVGSNENRITYPMMWVTPGTCSIEGKMSKLKMTVLLIDQVHLDDRSLADVLNDTLLIQHDIKALLHDPVNRDNYVMGEDADLTPIIQGVNNDYVAGWSAEYTLELSNLKDNCSIPMESDLTAQ